MANEQLYVDERINYLILSTHRYKPHKERLLKYKMPVICSRAAWKNDYYWKSAANDFVHSGLSITQAFSFLSGLVHPIQAVSPVAVCNSASGTDKLYGKFDSASRNLSDFAVVGKMEESWFPDLISYEVAEQELPSGELQIGIISHIIISRVWRQGIRILDTDRERSQPPCGITRCRLQTRQT